MTVSSCVQSALCQGKVFKALGAGGTVPSPWRQPEAAAKDPRFQRSFLINDQSFGSTFRKIRRKMKKNDFWIWKHTDITDTFYELSQFVLESFCCSFPRSSFLGVKSSWQRAQWHGECLNSIPLACNESMKSCENNCFILFHQSSLQFLIYNVCWLCFKNHQSQVWNVQSSDCTKSSITS